MKMRFKTLALEAFKKYPALQEIHITRDPQVVDLAGTIQDCPHMVLGCLGEQGGEDIPYSESCLDLRELDQFSWDLIEIMDTGETLTMKRSEV